MNKIDIPQIDSINKESSLQKISVELNRLKKNSIDKAPWHAYAYKPKVLFTIAYNDCIFIKYFVTEKSIRALYGKTNDPVYKDSCVEFFISFNSEAEYYNMEFNCIGTCLMGYGSGKTERQLLSEKLIGEIRHLAIIKSSNDSYRNDVNWELTLMIPLEIFAYHNIHSLKDQRCRGNFFKCGDELPEPHFLAWNNITAGQPDFHLPQFFGDIQFV